MAACSVVMWNQQGVKRSQMFPGFAWSRSQVERRDREGVGECQDRAARAGRRTFTGGSPTRAFGIVLSFDLYLIYSNMILTSNMSRTYV
jgi:hypothetical protein